MWQNGRQSLLVAFGHKLKSIKSICIHIIKSRWGFSNILHLHTVAYGFVGGSSKVDVNKWFYSLQNLVELVISISQQVSELLMLQTTSSSKQMTSAYNGDCYILALVIAETCSNGFLYMALLQLFYFSVDPVLCWVLVLIGLLCWSWSYLYNEPEKQYYCHYYYKYLCLNCCTWSEGIICIFSGD